MDQSADTMTIPGRIEIERQRFNQSRALLAATLGYRNLSEVDWSRLNPPAHALGMIARDGYDVLFIVTGTRTA